MSTELKLASEHLEEACAARIAARASHGPEPFVEEMMGAATRFVGALVEQGLEAELEAQAARFLIVPVIDMSFLRDRDLTLHLLRKSENVQNPEPITLCLGRMNFIALVPGLSEDLFSSHQAEYDHVSMVISHLSDRDWARWHLPIALEDAQHLLDDDSWSDKGKAILRQWRDSILRIKKEFDGCHALGCHILRKCWTCSTLGARSNERRVLVNRLAEEPARLFQATRDAARFLYAGTQGHGVGATAERASQPQITSPQGEALPQREPRYPEFPYGPVIDKKVRLRRALRAAKSRSSDRTILTDLASEGDLTYERIEGRKQTKVYFREQDLFNEVRDWLAANPQPKGKQRGPQAKKNKT